MASAEYEECVAHDLKQRAKCCVHYRAVAFWRDEQACAREVPIRAKACAANGGTNLGIALRLPCNAAPNPLFVCPWYEAMGPDLAAKEMTELREAGARTLKRLARQLSESR